MVVAHGHVMLEKMNHYEIEYVVSHAEYVYADSNSPDIAVAKLKQNLPIDWHELPIINFERIPVRTFGYMYSTGPIEGARPAMQLRRSKVVTRNYECERYPIYVNTTDKLFCYEMLGSIMRRGDSGAAVIATHEDESLENPFVFMAINTGMFLLREGYKKRVPRGVNVAYHYDWIKHTIYWMDEIPVPEQRVYFCCEQKTLQEYLLRPYHLREFAKVQHAGPISDWR